MNFDRTDPPLTAEERAKVDSLGTEQVQAIDDALMSHVSESWRKMARVVASAMLDVSGIIPSVPDGYFAERLRKLVRTGAVESRGDLETVRYCEVRRAPKP
jgi:Protein of unknown function